MALEPIAQHTPESRPGGRATKFIVIGFAIVFVWLANDLRLAWSTYETSDRIRESVRLLVIAVFVWDRLASPPTPSRGELVRAVVLWILVGGLVVLMFLD